MFIPPPKHYPFTIKYHIKMLEPRFILFPATILDVQYILLMIFRTGQKKKASSQACLGKETAMIMPSSIVSLSEKVETGFNAN
ncbi:hypothetical protein ABE28_011030 [Peribacillus muralis]|uniref:Uncharacterized protein n=1 Tax=Peribacillus muralis TaxID=264697 RepID=A0A1B3XNU4_9BACI|nr:hypothetical protein ABE28_011030 [Peribacillus muralis]